MKIIKKNSFERNNNNNNNNNKLLRMLEIGLIFEYIHTRCIVKLLTSSRTLLNFRGISPDIFYRVMTESFTVNKSIEMLTLIKLSSVSESLSQFRTSSLSNVNKEEVLVVKLPAQPFTLADLKIGSCTIKKIACCFNINNLRIVETNLALDEYDLVHVVEISSGSDREMLLNHYAVEISDGTYSVCPSYCDACLSTLCAHCSSFIYCESCGFASCKDCNEVKICDQCTAIFCVYCQDYGVCEECHNIICSSCEESTVGSGFCEDCEVFYCNDCGFVTTCNNCERTLCDGCH